MKIKLAEKAVLYDILGDLKEVIELFLVALSSLGVFVAVFVLLVCFVQWEISASAIRFVVVCLIPPLLLLLLSLEKEK